MKRTLHTLILLTLFIIYLPTSGQIHKIDSMLSASSSQDQFSGAILLVKNGEILLEKAFGQANNHKKIPNTTLTAFSIASIGKVFTATLIMKLAEEGKLKLTDPISFYLPMYNIPNLKKISIEHLLTHTSGLGNYMAHPQYADIIDNEITLDDIIPLISQQPLLFEEPGLRFEYSNSGYVLLGKIIEVVTRKSYTNVITEKILNPLSMSATQISIDRNDSKTLAIGYSKIKPSEEWISTWSTFPTPLSDGGIFTTVKDLYEFDKAFFSGRLVESETLQQMMAVHAEGNLPGLGKLLYGYGLMLTEKEGKIISVGHNGGSPGYGAEYRHYEVNNHVYTLIIQTNHDRVLRPIFSQIQNMILNNKI